ncbi:MAG: DUF1592 domain-containing protein [Planctomycetota bacterium]
MPLPICHSLSNALAIGGWFCVFWLPVGAAAAGLNDHARLEDFVAEYCLECHNAGDAIADVDLESETFSDIDWSNSSSARRDWELVYKRIVSRQMPPADAARPSTAEFDAIARRLGDALDRVDQDRREVPAVASLRRLTRTEYQNSVRDLLHVDVDASRWIPKDESSLGFDNITVGELSPMLLDRYLTAAQKISRLAVGRPTGSPIGITVRLPADLTQDRHLDGLPLGTRGGTLLQATLPESGTYQLAIRLTRDRDEMVEGLNRDAKLDVLVDGQRKHRFEVLRPKNKDYTHVDSNLNVRLPLSAGPHDIAVTFVDDGDSILTIKREPFHAAYNRHRHPRQYPAVFEVSIVGPLTDESETNESSVSAPAGMRSTPSQQRIFTVEPESSGRDDLIDAAERTLRPLLRHAYRREVASDDLRVPMQFFIETIDLHPTEPDRFERGIQEALAAVLVNPHFLFRVEDPSVEKVSDVELASRLSYFLWSSLPDDELLDLASSEQLSAPETLARQVDRMLADAKSFSLVNNFASQWLHLRNLDAFKPDLRAFPDFDENLRRAFRKETEWLFSDMMRRDASVLSLIESRVTFLNERLARHYGIPGVIGSHFRRVTLPADSKRGGILRHGSILSVTSYATRTSPTIRGNWILENLIGTPPPPPPPDVPTLKEKATLVSATFRERLAQHRQNDACATCHDLIDPVGFALDHYDAVGRYRDYDGDLAIDSSGILPDGTGVHGVADLEASLTAHPESFVSCMVEKLLTFALGRDVDHRDAATVRGIVKQAGDQGYRFSSLIRGMATSYPFRHRTVKP